MPFPNHLAELIDEPARTKSFSELARCSPGVLAGLTHSQGAQVMDALDTRTIEGVATSKYVLWAQAIATLARHEKSDLPNPALVAIVDARWEKKRLCDLAKAPPSILSGLSDKEAGLLEQALGVRTIEDLATNRYVLLAQVIARLAQEERLAPTQQAA